MCRKTICDHVANVTSSSNPPAAFGRYHIESAFSGTPRSWPEALVGAGSVGEVLREGMV